MTADRPPSPAPYPERWTYGSWYELALDLGPAGSDERLRAALRMVWSTPPFDGAWRDKDFGERADLDQASPVESLRFLYGHARLPGRRPLGCLSCIVREQAGDHPRDWLDVSLPTGMLEHEFSVVHPLVVAGNPWLAAIDAALAALADTVAGRVAFDLALIGEEASGHVNALEITPDSLRAARGAYSVVLSPALAAKLDLASEPLVRLSSGMLLAPAESSRDERLGRPPR